MATFRKQAWKNINWKQLANVEITSSWQPHLQATVLLYIAEMLQEGFPMLEIFAFLIIIFPKQETTFRRMSKGFSEGQYFYQVIALMNIKGNIAYQIQVAEAFGNFGSGLEVIAKYIQERDQQLKKLKGVLIYPLALICLMFAMLFGLRVFLLPQLNVMAIGESNKLLTYLLTFLQELPVIMIGVSIFLLIILFIYLIWKRKTNPLDRAKLYVKLPVIGKLFRLYYTHFFAYEFSQLFKIGYSVRQITESLRKQNEVVFLQAFGEYLDSQYNQGASFADSLKSVDVFTHEFPAIVLQGELLNQLAVKTRLYSQRVLRLLYQLIDQRIKVTQSILFVTVAICVVMVYLILMLPMLTMLETI
ncbi:competence type IV pilus assembly protein ComGB [Aerococcaceae bacterium 50-4]